MSQLDLIRRVNAVNVEPAPSTNCQGVHGGVYWTGVSSRKNPVQIGRPGISKAGPNGGGRNHCSGYGKLDQMEAEGIIVPVTEPTEWVSRMLVASKPEGDIRICLDPSELKSVWAFFAPAV